MQMLHFLECTFQETPAWVPQLQRLQDFTLLECDVRWQQSGWKSSAAALCSFRCNLSVMITVRNSWSRQCTPLLARICPCTSACLCCAGESVLMQPQSYHKPEPAILRIKSC